MLGLHFWAESVRKKSEDEERRALEVRIRRACTACKGGGWVGHYGGHSGSCSYSMVPCFKCSGLRLTFAMRGLQGLREEAAKFEAEWVAKYGALPQSL